MAQRPSAVVKQHLIDPEICIRCNTCEITCPIGAITHDAHNYVVDAAKCTLCMDCIAPCPTGAIDNWRTMPPCEPLQRRRAARLGFAAGRADGCRTGGRQASPPVRHRSRSVAPPPVVTAAATAPDIDALRRHAAALVGRACLHQALRQRRNPLTATVTGNVRVTEVGREYDTHHIVLDFGTMPFPVLEGQSIGIVPPGVDASGRPHHARQYSIASPRNGERPGYNNLSLTVKRVLEDHQGNPVRGVASNYLCDLKVGDKVQVIGPFGTSFLMPNHPSSHIVMICTGTGSAPMRAMIGWRHQLRTTRKFESGKLMLFFGARTQEELPYFGPLQKLPKDFIDINLAFSRTPGQPKRYVQDLMRERAADLAALLGRRRQLLLRLRPEEHGRRRRAGAARHRRGGRRSTGSRLQPRSSAKAGCTWRPTDLCRQLSGCNREGERLSVRRN